MKNTLWIIFGSLLVTNLYSTQALAAPPENSGKAKLSDKAFDDSFSKLPTNISSDTLTLRQEDRVFVYNGNVSVTQGDMTLTSKTLEGTYNEQNQIEKLIARGDVLITKADIKATSQQALYEAKDSTLTLIDNPELEQNGSILTADKIRIFLNDNRSQAEGQVRVKLINKEGGPKVLDAAGVAATATPANPSKKP